MRTFGWILPRWIPKRRLGPFRLRGTLLLVVVLPLFGGLSPEGQAQLRITPPKGQLAYVIDGVDVREDAPEFDSPPRFPGGRPELYRYLTNSMRALPPPGSLDAPFAIDPVTGAPIGGNGIGQTVLSIRLDAVGRVIEVATEWGEIPALDADFERVVRQMPDWEPAVVDRVETAVLVYLPLWYGVQGNRLVFDDSTLKATMGRGKKNKGLKIGLVATALAALVALLLLR